MTPTAPPSTPIPEGPIPVGLLGATGSVGQVFVRLLEQHPWFTLTRPMASERSAGRTYREAARWIQPSPIPGALAGMQVEDCEPGPESPGLVFSALDASVAGPIEQRWAEAGKLVVTNAKHHRMHPEVPLLVPEINPGHLELARSQSFGGGAILANPNCSTIGLSLALAPLQLAFGIEHLNVVTLQALSGAGLPGVASLEIQDNVLPYIAGEEDKLESELHKIFGSLEPDGLRPAEITVSAQCNRVAVSDGHTLCISVGLRREAREEQLIEAWNDFRAQPQELSLPSAPEHPTRYFSEPAAPQPRLHRDLEGGMGVAIGRLRTCPVLDYKFVALSHNTVRGAAGGSLLVAELAVSQGLARS